MDAKREGLLGRYLHPLDTVHAATSVIEIMVNAPDAIYMEQAGKLHAAGLCFPSNDHLTAAARNIPEFVRIGDL